MIEQRLRVDLEELFRGTSLAEEFEGFSGSVYDEIGVAKVIIEHIFDCLVTGSFEEIIRVEELLERFYGAMGMVEVIDEADLGAKKADMIGEKDRRLFWDYTDGAFEMNGRLAELSKKYGLPAPKLNLVCLSYDKKFYMLTVNNIIGGGAIDERFNGNLKELLQFILDEGEIVKGYSYGVNDSYIAELRQRVEAL